MVHGDHRTGTGMGYDMPSNDVPLVMLPQVSGWPGGNAGRSESSPGGS